MVKRREFLKQSVLASGMAFIPSFLKGMEFLSPEELSQHRNLIIIQLSGGNDGLNTIIPYRNDIYYQQRPNLAKKGEGVLNLNGDLGVNSSAAGLKELYDRGEMTVINNVGYPNPNRSHFRSMDIWHTASNANEYLKTGWIGRYMDAACTSALDAIEHQNQLSLLMKGSHLKGIAVTNPEKLYKSTQEDFFKTVAEKAKAEMLSENNQGYLYKTLLETYSSAEYIYEKTRIYRSSFEYPKSAVATHLKGIGEMINSGLSTRVYYYSFSGFDSHVNQQHTQDKLLKTYSEAVVALVNDLKKSGKFKDTLILTFSEFGRRVKENGSKGTDHGTANNVLLMSGSLKKKGIYNEAPNLVDLDGQGDIKYTVDFRSIYATILKNWLMVEPSVILGSNFKLLTFV